MTNIIDIPQVRSVLQQLTVYDIGAEVFPPGLYNKIRLINKDAYIMNGYGPTETTISSSVSVLKDEGRITIGRPGSNVRRAESV
ncbi:amino acid adenylation domain-containing protein [Streptococcus catagoni]|uniref:amino acid adenylation domain-containing protein n=1 Tax=Streptococcus catagoni TaxID=2654874 RepID=UPI00140BD0C4|nr:amino acid adenylation domain-containing protein [Streptococcus catagoni]